MWAVPDEYETELSAAGGDLVELLADRRSLHLDLSVSAAADLRVFLEAE